MRWVGYNEMNLINEDVLLVRPISSSYGQISHIIGEDKNLEGWKRSIRARVTALKFHIMAAKGLTTNGRIIQPYSPDILLNMASNAAQMKGVNKEDINKYVSEGLKKLPLTNIPVSTGKENSVKTNEGVSVEEVKLQDVSNEDNSNQISPGPSIFIPKNLNVFVRSASLVSPSCSVDEVDSGIDSKEPSEAASDQTITRNDSAIVLKENAFNQMKKELKERKVQVSKLLTIQDEVECELQDLTANLFQEAHSMVQEANLKAANAERNYKEASMQVEVLQAEVVALKALVLTSTPSTPNPHLHPQIISKGQAIVQEAGKIFRGHKKSPSDFDLKYGRDTTPPSSPLKDVSTADMQQSHAVNGFPLEPDCWEVDPVVHREFVSWRQEPVLSQSDPFMARVYNEDINLCLGFTNSILADKVETAIEQNSLYIEEVNPRQKNCPNYDPDDTRKCVLLEVPRYCKYRFRLGEKDSTWYYISMLARNRIIAVCDFLNYLRYIQQGLVKSSIHDVYWEVVKLRRQMVLARLGF